MNLSEKKILLIKLGYENNITDAIVIYVWEKMQNFYKETETEIGERLQNKLSGKETPERPLNCDCPSCKEERESK